MTAHSDKIVTRDVQNGVSPIRVGTMLRLTLKGLGILGIAAESWLMMQCVSDVETARASAQPTITRRVARWSAHPQMPSLQRGHHGGAT